MKVAAISAVNLYAAGRRLDASYHAGDGQRALYIIHQWARQSPGVAERASYGTRRLDVLLDLCLPRGIFIGGRSKRIYVTDAERGVPFLSSSDMLLVSFEGVKLISERQPDLDSMLLRKGWTLISRSGTIGNVVYAREDMDGLAASEHIMRVVPDPERVPPGYVYAFLSSSTGNAILKGSTFGSLVDTIAPEQVGAIPVPRLEPAIEQRIHELVEQAAALRVEAQKARSEAQQLASTRLGVDLSRFSTAKMLAVSTSGAGPRLEAVYRATQEAAAVAFQACRAPMARIGNLLLDMFYLGKLHRVFVSDSEWGVPLLSIADAQKGRLTSDKFVSKTRSRNVNQSILRQGYILVSRVGTPGLAIYVRDEMVGMAGTDHLVRLVCDESKVLPGYLYSILSSQVGYALLVGSAHGSVQLVLPPEYIAVIEIPVLPLAEQRPVHELIERYGRDLSTASQKEEEAQRLLAAALEAN